MYNDNPTTKKIFCSAVIVAGGSSARFGADKLFAPIDGVPTLARSISALASCDFVSELIVVVRPEILTQTKLLAEKFGQGKLAAVCSGGSSRTESAVLGLAMASPHASYIAIHDGARPLLSHKVAEEAFKAACCYGAAAPAIPVKDTIKEAAEAFVLSTPDRSRLYAVQTPQIFRAELIKTALSSAMQNNRTVTDDCSAVEALGKSVFLSPGSEENIKITSPLDIDLAEAILRRRTL